jgi:DNA-binding transcriptional MocR family regulator
VATSIITMSTAPAAPVAGNVGKGAPAASTTLAVINLRKGTPATSELPRSLLQKASQDLFALSDLSDTNAMQYGDDFSPFTAQLSKFLTRQYGHQVLAGEVYPVSGVSHGLDILSSVLATAGDVVLCEVSRHSIACIITLFRACWLVAMRCMIAFSALITRCACPHLFSQEPSYFLSYGIFAERGLEVMPLARHSSSNWNLTAAALEQALQSVQQQGKRCAFVYLVPTHSNPTSHTLSLQTRKELIQVRFEISQAWLVC